jgi:hypothetical protein
MPTLSDIENAVTAQNTVIDSVAVLLNHLTDQIAAANRSGDSDTIARIIGEIQDGTARLTSAVTANTPGGPAVVTPLPVASAPEPVVVPLPPVDTSVETPPAPVQTAETTPSDVPPVVDNVVDTTVPPVDTVQ